MQGALIRGNTAGPYPERISYWLTGMGAQKSVPKKQNIKLFGITCLFVKRKFNEDFSINYPYNSKWVHFWILCPNYGKKIFSFNFYFDWTTKWIGAKLIRQTNAIISVEPYIYIYDLDSDEITDCMFLSCHVRISDWIHTCLTVKCVHDTTRTYSQMHHTDKYSEHSSIIRSVWPNGWVFI